MGEKKAKKTLGTFTLAMLTVAAIVSLRNLPMTAELGLSSVFFLIVAGLLFFIPTALIVAELAAAWPHSGGCYVWVGEAFGKKIGFITLWLSWMASVTWFPAILAFIATIIAGLLDSLLPGTGLADNQIYFVLVMLLVFWGATIINFYGIELSGLLSSIGVIVGTIIPGILIVGMGLWWLGADNPTEVSLSFNSFVPSINKDNLILFSGVLLSLAGVELAAYHIKDARDPQHSYPKAVLLAILMILIVYIFGTLAIVIVVPNSELTLAGGLLQAFTVFFARVGFNWLIPLIALFLLSGALAGFNAWVIGPAKGMLVVAEDGLLPEWLAKVNDKGVPVNLLLVQAIVGSILCTLFFYINNHSSTIWMMTVLCAQFSMVVYFMIFMAAYRLRSIHPNIKRPFKTPFLKLLSVLGSIVCVFSFFVVYLPHDRLVTYNYLIYCGLLLLILIILSLPPLLMVYFNRGR